MLKLQRYQNSGNIKDYKSVTFRDDQRREINRIWPLITSETTRLRHDRQSNSTDFTLKYVTSEVTKYHCVYTSREGNVGVYLK